MKWCEAGKYQREETRKGSWKKKKKSFADLEHNMAERERAKRVMRQPQADPQFKEALNTHKHMQVKQDACAGT